MYSSVISGFVGMSLTAQVIQIACAQRRVVELLPNFVTNQRDDSRRHLPF